MLNKRDWFPAITILGIRYHTYWRYMIDWILTMYHFRDNISFLLTWVQVGLDPDMCHLRDYLSYLLTRLQEELGPNHLPSEGLSIILTDVTWWTGSRSCTIWGITYQTYWQGYRKDWILTMYHLPGNFLGLFLQTVCSLGHMSKLRLCWLQTWEFWVIQLHLHQ